MEKVKFYVLTIISVILICLFSVLEPMAKQYSQTSFHMGPYFMIATLAWPIIFGLIGYIVIYGLELFYLKREEKENKDIWLRIVIVVFLGAYVVLYAPHWIDMIGRMFAKEGTYHPFFENQTIWNVLSTKLVIFMQYKTFLFLFVGGAIRLVQTKKE